MRPKLTIPTEYFYDEIRDGFYVNGMMKRAWAAQLEIITDIDELCTKYGLRYMADWGTLLGAVRHGGYVPWDDDFDIGMPRADYDRFLEVAGELGGDYRVLTYETDGYSELFGRVVNSHAICLNPDFISKYHGTPFSLGIDVFPYDYLYRDEEMEQERRSRYNAVARMMSLVKSTGTVTGEIRDKLRQLQKLTGYNFLESEDVMKGLYRCLNAMISECPDEEADYIADYQNYYKKNCTYKLPKDNFDRLIPLDYEMIQLPVPSDYEEVLKSKFGDFLNIVKEWTVHDYPYYGTQLKILQQHKPDYYPGYRFNREDLPTSVNNEAQINTGNIFENIKGDILFMPAMAGNWDTLEPAWRQACNASNCNVYVMPLPYYDKTWDGQQGQLHYERDLFPEEVETIDLEGYDLNSRRPAAIIIQDGRDEYAETVTVHPMFYSGRLRKYTDNLILIPCLEPDAPDEHDVKGLMSLDHFVTMPGVLRADRVYVGSEKMREAYIKKLAEFAGTGEDVRECLAEKVCVAPWPEADARCIDGFTGTDDHDGADESNPVRRKTAAKMVPAEDIPEEWLNIIRKNADTYKKVMLYEINASAMSTYGSVMVDKVARSIEIFRENKDNIALILRVHPTLEVVCAVLEPEMQERFLDILEQYVAGGWGIFDPSPDAETAGNISDAYYGDITDQILKFTRAGKPVMIESPEV